MKAPIAVMSFNRPGYLEQVLESLIKQRPDSLVGREVHLFQDGAVNKYSGLRYAQDEDIAASVEAFKRVFPGGIVHHAEQNVGICENFYRAEDYFFKERNFDCALFFEDDLLLSPCYLDMMDILQRFAEISPRVAYFAAYGDYYSSAEQQAQHRRDVILLDHHWAFGLMRKHWLRIREQTAEYHGMVLGIDYARRNHKAIYQIYDKYKAVPAGTSQDAAKAFACDRLGLLRCRTYATFARYIGSKGAHMTPEKFERLGFSKAVMIEEPINDLIFPEPPQIDAMLRQQREEFQRIYREDLPKMIAGRAATLDPMRLADENDVAVAYRVMLHRLPEPEALAAHVGKTKVYLLVRGIMGSDEYKALSGAAPNPKVGGGDPSRPYDPQRLCGPDDVVAIYRLILHRDPEGEQIIANHVGKRKVTDLVKAMLASREYRTLSEQQGS